MPIIMKNASLIFIFMLILLHCQGQNLLQEGKLWSNTSLGTMPGSTYTSYLIKFIDDTTINGRQYRNIMKSKDELHANWSGNGYIREEADTRKVFVFNKLNQKDILLYDFSLKTGDSILTGNGATYVKVTDVTNAPFGSTMVIRKQISFFDMSGNTRWIEGIGSAWGILEGLNSFYTTGATSSQVCYYENEQLQYHNPGFSNCFPKGLYSFIDEGLKKQIPLVVVSYDKDRVMFTFNEMNTSNSVLQLFNLNGEKVLETRLAGASSFVLLGNNISPGIYIYHYQNNALTSSDKILIK